MIRPMRTLGAGAATIAALALAAVALNTRGVAQDQGYGRQAPPPMEPGMARRTQEHPGMPGAMGGPGMMPMMGHTTMIDDAENLYVLRGGDLFKIDKDDMRIKGQAHLPMGPGGREGMRGGGPPDLLPPRGSEMKPQ